MGTMISPNVSVTRLDDYVRKTMRTSLARGGEIAKAADSRLSASVAAIDAAAAVRKTTAEAEAVAWAQVLAEDAKSDDAILALRDTMWNLLGRMRQSPDMDQVFPGGVSIYTSGDPRHQPLLMDILRSRILAAASPRWTEAQRTEWAGEIEALRVSYEAAVTAHRPTEAAANVADATYRAAVRTAHARLRTFKHDLPALGLSEVQIHEIIPDASAGQPADTKKKTNGAGAAPVAPAITTPGGPATPAS